MTIYQRAGAAHAGCMVCGDSEQNPDALGLEFSRDSDGTVTATLVVTERHQGYQGLLHGGMTSTLLDAAMTHCLLARGIRALTAELTVRFIAPIETGQPLTLCGRLLGQRRGIYQLEGTISRGQHMLARATAKFIAPSGNQLASCADTRS